MSVVGTNQAGDYFNSLGIDLHHSPTQSTFVAGDLKKNSVGKLNIILPTLNGDVPMEIHVV